MGVLEGLEPAAVFHFFEEICGIPHGSGNEKRLSDHLKQFAGQRGLECIQDEAGNIIIIKEAAPGYEAEETMILQGHMDMVAVKDADCDLDLRTEGLRLQREGDYIFAAGTSLGGDDGIAVAYILAVLDDKTIEHPRLECVITVGEEVGMDGARVLDLSVLKGKRMLNLDNEEEGILLTSCAGGVRADIRLPVSYEEQSGTLLSIQVSGLAGGHSGAEIIRGGGNANCLMGQVLDAILQQMDVNAASLEGGMADNAIPAQAQALLCVAQKDVERACAIIRDMEEKFRKELAVKDAGVRINVSVEKQAGACVCLSKESMRKATALLLAAPNGIQAMSADVEGLVETSLNLGVMKLNKEALELSFAVRSSLESAKEAVCRRLCAVSELAGAGITFHGDYPGWAYRQESPLREMMIRVYERMYGQKPRIEAIHAGLECGIFSGKLPELDCISFGPDMKDVHTPKEALCISSVKNVWEYLLEVLKQKD
ncbi:MAG: aminoacyl-histidine dipeptidase [Roseburia sp.]|nr:aminoacyl-histidine dipeptidase [Roseburia sp.]MCM1242705.1 aminoacyl-histidine dipeptidase [Roseburia sp.]